MFMCLKIFTLAFLLFLTGVALGSSLEDEIANDPLGRGYSGMTDEQILTSLNTKDRSRNRATMTASEVANEIDIGEFNALSNASEAKIWNVLHLGTINPFGIEVTIFVNAFGGGSTTITNLRAARVVSISRKQELRMGRVKIGQIEDARP